MNKTTEALKLAEEALHNVQNALLFVSGSVKDNTTSTMTADAHDDADKALAAIREALAEQDHIAASGKQIDEPVKPEPIAWEATSAGVIKFVTDSRYKKFSQNIQQYYKPYRCSHCSEPVKQEPVAYKYKESSPETGEFVFAEPVKQAPVDGLARACNLAGLDYEDFLRIKAYLPVAAPVDAKAIQHCPCCGSDYFAGKTRVDLDAAVKSDPLYLQGRAEALEEAANVLDEAIKHDWNIPHKPELVNCAAAIRGLK